MRKKYLIYSPSQNINRFLFVNRSYLSQYSECRSITSTSNITFSLYEKDYLITWISKTENLYNDYDTDSTDLMRYLENPPLTFSYYISPRHKIKKIVMNKYIIHCITMSDVIFSWGNDVYHYNLLGYVDNEIKSPIKNEVLMKKGIYDIELSDTFCVGKSADGHWYIWGDSYNNSISQIEIEDENTFDSYKCGNCFVVFNKRYEVYLYMNAKRKMQKISLFTKNKGESVDSIFAGNEIVVIKSNKDKIYILNREGLHEVTIKEDIKIINVKVCDNEFYINAIENKRNVLMYYKNSRKDIFGKFTVNDYILKKYYVNNDKPMRIISNEWFQSGIFYEIECSEKDKDSIKDKRKKMFIDSQKSYQVILNSMSVNDKEIQFEEIFKSSRHTHCFSQEVIATGTEGNIDKIKENVLHYRSLSNETDYFSKDNNSIPEKEEIDNNKLYIKTQLTSEGNNNIKTTSSNHIRKNEYNNDSLNKGTTSSKDNNDNVFTLKNETESSNQTDKEGKKEEEEDIKDNDDNNEIERKVLKGKKKTCSKGHSLFNQDDNKEEKYINFDTLEDVQPAKEEEDEDIKQSNNVLQIKKEENNNIEVNVDTKEEPKSESISSLRNKSKKKKLDNTLKIEDLQESQNSKATQELKTEVPKYKILTSESLENIIQIESRRSESSLISENLPHDEVKSKSSMDPKMRELLSNKMKKLSLQEPLTDDNKIEQLKTQLNKIQKRPSSSKESKNSIIKIETVQRKRSSSKSMSSITNENNNKNAKDTNSIKTFNSSEDPNSPRIEEIKSATSKKSKQFVSKFNNNKRQLTLTVDNKSKLKSKSKNYFNTQSAKVDTKTKSKLNQDISPNSTSKTQKNTKTPLYSHTTTESNAPCHLISNTVDTNEEKNLHRIKMKKKNTATFNYNNKNDNQDIINNLDIHSSSNNSNVSSSSNTNLPQKKAIASKISFTDTNQFNDSTKKIPYIPFDGDLSPISRKKSSNRKIIRLKSQEDLITLLKADQNDSSKLNESSMYYIIENDDELTDIVEESDSKNDTLSNQKKKVSTIFKVKNNKIIEQTTSDAPSIKRRNTPLLSLKALNTNLKLSMTSSQASSSRSKQKSYRTLPEKNETDFSKKKYSSYEMWLNRTQANVSEIPKKEKSQSTSKKKLGIISDIKSHTRNKSNPLQTDTNSDMFNIIKEKYLKMLHMRNPSLNIDKYTLDNNEKKFIIDVIAAKPQLQLKQIDNDVKDTTIVSMKNINSSSIINENMLAIEYDEDKSNMLAPIELDQSNNSVIFRRSSVDYVVSGSRFNPGRRYSVFKDK